MSKYERSSKMTCEQAELLMVPVWGRMAGISDRQIMAFHCHLIVCPACADEYEQTGRMMALAEDNWGPVSDQTRRLLEEAGYEVSVRAGRSPSGNLAGTEDSGSGIEYGRGAARVRTYRLFVRAAAIAACLVFAVLVWMMVPDRMPGQVGWDYPGSAGGESAGRIELVDSAGNIEIAAGQLVTAGDELQTLLIDGRHSMVMNVGTSLTVEPFEGPWQTGWLVRLDSGQIYTRVRSEGNPFVVDTAHGRAVITGTVFDIEAVDASTRLVVAEGSVRFESEKGSINVSAGQVSRIVGRSAPSVPVACNAAELTAWASGSNFNTTLTQGPADDLDWYLSLPSRPEPIVLAETDYCRWVEQKRQWFKVNFPWIFDLKKALRAEGIKVDYPELLIESDDVWQFACLKDVPGRFAMPDFEALLKTAKSFGFDKQWLLESMPIAKAVQNKPALSEGPAGLAAFDQLLEFANGTETAPYYLYPADACKYLIETRSLIWFAIDAGRYNLTQAQRTEIQDLLQQQVVAATKCRNVLLYPHDKQESLYENACTTPKMKMAEYIERTKAIEIELRNIGKKSNNCIESKWIVFYYVSGG